MVLTVMSRVSGHWSMGPTEVWLQSKARVRRGHLAGAEDVILPEGLGSRGGLVVASLDGDFTVTKSSCSTGFGPAIDCAVSQGKPIDVLLRRV